MRASYRQAKTKEMRYNEVTDKREKHITLLQRLPWYIFNSSAVGLFVSAKLKFNIFGIYENLSLKPRDSVRRSLGILKAPADARN